MRECNHTSWKHDTSRRHGRHGFVFVKCTICGKHAQASINDSGKIGTPFFTARHYTGERKTIIGTYRLTKTRRDEIVAAYGSVQKYLDNGSVL